jgi:RNA polymerase sigma-70 factor (ECF subfamily)
MDDTQKQQLDNLMALTALGDQSAFSQLYQQTSSLLYAIAFRILKRNEHAEEALQEAYVKIWHNASEYNSEKGAVLTWMGSIVRYRCLDMLRKAKPVESIDEHLEYMILEDDDPGPLEQALQQGDAQALLECIDELKEKQRRSILMAFYEGLTHEQLSRSLSVPLGTIKSWIRRSLEKIKECLG